LALEADDYRLTGEPARGMFGPAVVDDRNLEGPFSIGVPGQVAGMTLAHRECGSLRGGGWWSRRFVARGKDSKSIGT
jgi:gamma-glutamyltranspeptidase/glutathione hydrolase